MTVQRNIVVKKLAEIKVENKEGIIDAFNVLVNYLPVTFWNNFANASLI